MAGVSSYGAIYLRIFTVFGKIPLYKYTVRYHNKILLLALVSKQRRNIVEAFTYLFNNNKLKMNNKKLWL